MLDRDDDIDEIRRRLSAGLDPLADTSSFATPKQMAQLERVEDEPPAVDPSIYVEELKIDSDDQIGQSISKLIQQNLGGSPVGFPGGAVQEDPPDSQNDSSIEPVPELMPVLDVAVEAVVNSIQPVEHHVEITPIETDSPAPMSEGEEPVIAVSEPEIEPIVAVPVVEAVPALAQQEPKLQTNTLQKPGEHEGPEKSAEPPRARAKQAKPASKPDKQPQPSQKPAPNLDPGFVGSIEQLPDFKGAVARVVNEKSQKDVIVLDIGCATVVVVSTPEFMESPMHLSLVATLKGPRFQLAIQKEYLATVEFIAELRTVSERRSQQKLIPVINADNKHIVLYDEIFAKAVALKATDIHFEIANADTSTVRLRIYGRLHRWMTFPSDLLRGALTAAYSKRTKSGTNSAGALSLERAMNTMTEQLVFGKSYNGRFNGYPLVNGYDVVIRVLESDPKSVVPTVQDLGYAQSHVDEQILPAIRRNAGMIAISGSTGSGKSTALRSFIYSLPERDSLKIFGVEDPVEYENTFMRQISVQRNSDDEEAVVRMKFLSALRSVLRMDPDVLMLGEIRDRDSASLASEFNRTGHRVFTTVHGDGCVDVLARLTGEEIGIHPSTLAAKKYLSAVMYQKLMPLLCPKCKVPAVGVLSQRTQELLREKFKLNPEAMFVSSQTGCPHCRIEGMSTGGTKGLTVVAEILTPTEEILERIRERDWMGVEKLWRESRVSGFDDSDMRGKTAFEHALYKASIGLLDIQDIEADFESLSSYQLT